ncbi:hypothetical protein J437_LFUL004658 [Ladona fulva]|uniref:MATH domain-containing protein n=1 Tax=Ladona fulva TaxID=123851 RepID=A0A8K0NWC5_LADFU|nr:hypothetical protein J437_LFUL004658 [Ladona fulva]
MENRFKSLEAQIADLLNALKLMIVNLENKLTLQNGELPTQHSLANIPLQNEDETFRCVEPHCSTPFTESVRFYPQETVEKLDQGKWIDEVDDSTAFITDTEWPREDEISRLNNTVHMEPYPESPLKNTASPVHRVFTYYWRMHGIASKINSWDPRRSLRSPSFYITPNGYRMYLLVFPRQNYENFYVHVGITVGANDANLSWPFSLKHRIQLLDQVRTPSSKKKRPLIPTRPMLPQDLASRVWNPALLCSASVWRRPLLGDSTECVGLGYPHEMLKSRNYIYNDSVVIKLTVYLE